MRTGSASIITTRPPVPSRRGWMVGAPIALGHAAVIAAMLAGGPPVARGQAAPAMSLYAVAESPAMPATPSIEFQLQAVAVEQDIPLLDIDRTAAASSAEGACDLTDTVQDSLRRSSTVRAALDELPRNERSVANAVMLWDGQWIDGASPGARAALGKIRAVVTAAVAAASAPCRAATQSGPRLISVAGAPDTVLALGSGRWRWDDLASP